MACLQSSCGWQNLAREYKVADLFSVLHTLKFGSRQQCIHIHLYALLDCLQLSFAAVDKDESLDFATKLYQQVWNYLLLDRADMILFLHLDIV